LKEKNIDFLGFFQYYYYNILSFFTKDENKLNLKIKKDKRNLKLYKIEKFLKNYINEKFEILKYFKQYNHYKYLKRVILTNDQKTTLKNISNFKTDFLLLYKPEKKIFHEKVDREFYKNAWESNNNEKDERIKDLIDSLYFKNQIE